MMDRLTMWLASKSGGHCTVQTEKVSSGSRRIVRLCMGKDCSFKLVAARGKGAGATWSVSFESSVFRSAAPTQSKRSRGFRCTRTGQRLANAEGVAAGAQRYRAGIAPSPRST
eukprot:COSAG06_NODE_4474_length_4217_cov_11.624089_5_plen_113_part_00